MEELRDCLEFASKWTLVSMPFVFTYVIITYFKSLGKPKKEEKNNDDDKPIKG